MTTLNSRARRIAATVLTLFATHVRGGPLEPSFTPSDPAWIVHLDLEAARHSKLGSTLIDSLGEARRESIHTLAADLGLSSPDSIRSITVYAEKEADSGAAVIVLGKDADNLPAALQLRNLPSFESAQRQSTALMSWESDGNRVHAALLPIDDERRALLFAKTELSRSRAIERILLPHERNTPRVPDSNSNEILFARILDMNAPAMKTPRARILKLTTAVEASFAEHSSSSKPEECISTIRFTAGTSQDAEAMRNICTGLLQATRLSMSKKPELAEFESSIFDSIELSISDSILTVKARHSSHDLAMLVEAFRSFARPQATPAAPPALK